MKLRVAETHIWSVFLCYNTSSIIYLYIDACFTFEITSIYIFSKNTIQFLLRVVGVVHVMLVGVIRSVYSHAARYGLSSSTFYLPW